jgi:hypothetical protein
VVDIASMNMNGTVSVIFITMKVTQARGANVKNVEVFLAKNNTLMS